jgi:hypothetical protein
MATILSIISFKQKKPVITAVLRKHPIGRKKSRLRQRFGEHQYRPTGRNTK